MGRPLREQLRYSASVAVALAATGGDFEMLGGYRLAAQNYTTRHFPADASGSSNIRRGVPIASSIPYADVLAYRPVVNGWYQTTGGNIEENHIAGKTFHGVFEDSFLNGTRREATWGGAATLDVSPGANHLGDWITHPLAGQTLGWRVFQRWTSGPSFGGTHAIYSARNEGYAGTGSASPTDQSLLAGNATPTNSDSFGDAMSALIVRVRGSRRGQVGHSVALVGDSITRGAGDNIIGADRGDPTTGFAGWIERALGTAHGVTNLGQFGNSSMQFQANLGSGRVIGMLGLTDSTNSYKLVDRIINCLGTNDSSTNFAALRDAMVATWNGMRTANPTAKIAQTTTTPQVAKIDGGQPYTPANQNNAVTGGGRFVPGSGVDLRNIWLRDGAPLDISSGTPVGAATGATGANIIRIGDAAHPVSLLIDVCAIACTGPSTMTWKDGYLYDQYNAGDGIHPATAGHIAIRDAVLALPQQVNALWTNPSWSSWIGGSFVPQALAA